MTIKCRELIDITMLADPHKHYICTVCRKEYYKIIDEHPCLYYTESDGSLRKGAYKSHLEEIL